MRRLQAVLATALVPGLIGCESEGTPPVEEVTILGVEDGAYLGGEHTAAIDIHSARAAQRVELYLDGLRIAADELAPFEVSWDTRQFDEGPHQLTARAYFDDGFGESHRAITIDNTAPTVDPLPGSATVGQDFLVIARDNFKLGRVELHSLGQEPRIDESEPFALPWTFACGAVTVEVRVFDAAGSMTSLSHVVSSADPADADCDGFRAVSAGGDDCNDGDASYNPGATEYREGLDRNCDGIATPFAAVDADGDGVSSTATGGDDCNDLDPEIHGGFLVLAPRALGRTWQPGEAALTGEYGTSDLYINDGSTVDLLRLYPEELFTVKVAAGANPLSLAPVDPYRVVFGRGDDVVLASNNFVGWDEQVLFRADGPVGRMAYSVSYAPYTEAVVYQAGTNVYLAESVEYGPWSSQLLVDAGEPLAQAPLVWTSELGARVVLRTAKRARMAHREGASGSFSLEDLGPTDPLASLSATLASGWMAFVASKLGSQFVIHSEDAAEPIFRTTNPIGAIAIAWPYLVIQVDNTLQLRHLLDEYRLVQTIYDVPAFDTSYGSLGFAGGGILYERAAGSVEPVEDVHGDGIDRDCDGSDS